MTTLRFRTPNQDEAEPMQVHISNGQDVRDLITVHNGSCYALLELPGGREQFLMYHMLAVMSAHNNADLIADFINDRVSEEDFDERMSGH